MIANTAASKYDAIARDYRVTAVRPATFDESNGERGWVVVVLAEGCTFDGHGEILAYGVTDARKLLKLVHEVQA